MSTTTPKPREILHDKIGSYFVKKVIIDEDYSGAVLHRLSKYSLIRKIELVVLRLIYK